MAAPRRLRAGLLRHRITVQQVSSTGTNAYGETSEVWVPFKEINAQVDDLTGVELERANQVHADATAIVRMRRLEGFDPTMRFVHGSRILNPVAVVGDETGQRTQEVLCREEVA